jgi:hypothetical protein
VNHHIKIQSERNKFYTESKVEKEEDIHNKIDKLINKIWSLKKSLINLEEKKRGRG